MNILFLSQSSTLSVFYDVMKSLRNKTTIRNVGFYIADSSFYDKFTRENPEFLQGNYDLLKEWAIIEKSTYVKPDINHLRGYEKRLGDPYLWNAIVADRRIYFGRKASVEQDYSCKFDHERILSIIQCCVEEMEAFFDRVQPDIVIGFICVTIGEYIAHLVSNVRNIRFLNLRPTRIRNYFYGGESVLEPSEQLKVEYERILSEGIEPNLRKDVISFLDSARTTHAMYEGVIPAGGSIQKKNIKGIPERKTGFLKKLTNTTINLTREYYNYNYGKYRYDNHYKGSFYPLWFNKIKRPLRLKMNNLYLKQFYINANQLRLLNYAFYPLHKEPEVTLLVYSRPYLNQIEAIRNFARSLPVGMKLLVKEHPASVGYRPLSYYKKLLSIPNVIMAPPDMTSRDIIQNTSLIFIISGSVGFEGLMLKKPVIHLGNISFTVLPETMIRHVRDLNRLAWEVHDLLKNHKHDEESLIAYIATVMTTSVSIDFYSELLGRKGVYKVESIGVRIEHIDRLANYILNTFLNTHKHSKALRTLTTRTFN